MLRIKKFDINASGHGGERRSAQINEIFGQSSIKDLSFNLLQGNRLAKIKSVISPLAISSSILKNMQKDLTFIQELRELVKLDYVIKQLDNSEWIDQYTAVIWESTYDDQWFIPFLLKERYKKDIFSFPHNIESLVPGQHSGIFSNQHSWFFNELNYLKQCDHVFTISEEEEWLLQTCGIRASHLPYYPIITIEDELKKIRQKRQSIPSQDSFLIVGSVTNIPTYNGMQSLLEFISTTIWPDNVEFIVAGFGTECFKQFGSNKSIKVLGTVSKDKLNSLMAEVKLVLINQQSSTGVLTKIIEFLISGIPVVCNKASSRTYQSYNGVTVFSNFNELGGILLDDFMVPDLPEKPVTHYNKAIEIIQNSESL